MSAIGVTCPQCGAMPGASCTYTAGEYTGLVRTAMPGFHRVRTEAGMNVVTPAEARHVLFYYGQDGGVEPGGFVHSLLLAISRADADNLNRLRQGFPGYVAAMRDWTPQDLQTRLTEED